MSKLVKVEAIKDLILDFRGQKVMLDRDLGMVYGVETRGLIQAVKRNKERFPKDFIFQLNDHEVDLLVSQSVIPHKKYFGGRNPYVFTRNGANMLSAVLKTQTAVYRSIQIMRAFSALEEAVSGKRKGLVSSPKILKQLSTHSRAIMQLFQDIKIKGKMMDKMAEIQNEIIELLKQIVLWSMKYDD